MRARAEARATLNDTQRVALLEDDVDSLERGVRELTRSFDVRLQDLTESVDSRLSKILWTMVGLLISVTTACIVWVISVAVRA